MTNFFNFKSEKPAVSFVFFTALVVILIIVVLLMVFYRRPMTEEQKEAWRRGEEQKVASLISVGNFDKCSDVKYTSVDGIDYKTVCQNNIALKKAEETLDISWCGKVDNKLISKDECEQRVIQPKLLKENNLSVCDAVSSQAVKNSCISSYWYLKALADKDVLVCKNSPDPQFCEEDYWTDRLKKSPASVDCNKISSIPFKNDCDLFKKALNQTKGSERAGLCRQILNFSLQFICQ